MVHTLFIAALSIAGVDRFDVEALEELRGKSVAVFTYDRGTITGVLTQFGPGHVVVTTTQGMVTLEAQEVLRVSSAGYWSVPDSTRASARRVRAAQARGERPSLWLVAAGIGGAALLPVAVGVVTLIASPRDAFVGAAGAFTIAAAIVAGGAFYVWTLLDENDDRRRKLNGEEPPHPPRTGAPCGQGIVR